MNSEPVADSVCRIGISITSCGDLATMSSPFDPVAHYDDYGDNELTRLTDTLYGQLEFEETTAVLEESLPNSGHVLDVGSGPGRYATWLADRGYQVTAVEPSRRQRELARERVAETGHEDTVTVVAGDVRNLPTPSNKADATLCLGGPLSHVLTAAEREAAATELARVTVDDGPVVVSVMGRLAALQTIVRSVGRQGPNETALLPELARTGTYDESLLEKTGLEPTAPPMHLFRVSELTDLLSDAGCSVEGVTGLESVASQRRTDFEAFDEADRTAIRSAVAELRWDRGVADCSGHFLALAQA